VRRQPLALVTILTSVILLLTVLGFFADDGVLVGVQWILINWAVIIAAFAVILGFINILAVHIDKLTSRAASWPYSLALILSAVGVLAIGLGELIFRPEEGLWGPVMSLIFVWVIAPLQAAAAALLPFILTYAAFHALRLGREKGVLLFFVSALVVLVGQVPVMGISTELRQVRELWLSWLAIPGLRALLIGVALGIAMTALRLIMGIDRPQS